MDFRTFKYIYFIGIGGIGMSALARYFNLLGYEVAGYDKVSTLLTDDLTHEGIHVHFNDDVGGISANFFEPKLTLVIYTPAIPKGHRELQYFMEHGYQVKKRSEILGAIVNKLHTVAVAGTHGKTTISTITSHLLNQLDRGCTAFLGGISKNYHTNIVKSENSSLCVVEADEYDRSFLFLYPKIIILSSLDADHLDIYKKESFLHENYTEFINHLDNGGILIKKIGLELKNLNAEIKTLTYALDNTAADFYALNIKLENGSYEFDIQTPDGVINNILLGVPGLINIENAVAAVAAATLCQTNNEQIRKGLATFKGIERRFDVRFRHPEITYIDDYAHHPEEIKATIKSVRHVFPNKKIFGIFQPHLYSRTRDFAKKFAKSLDLLDSLILLDIYPAREEPIEGVSSQLIFDKMKLKNKKQYQLHEVIENLEKQENTVYLTMGAGSIGYIVSGIEEKIRGFCHINGNNNR
jgi:UDP-N-acetylmuramate--alanine ligase